MTTPTSTGIVLLAHGSRDPLWRLPIEAVRTQLLHQHPHQRVRCAYVELCSPNIFEAAQALLDEGADRLRIVPLFLGAGRHARDDLASLTQRLHELHPGLAIDVQTTVGEDPRLIAQIADIAYHPMPRP